MKIGRREAKNRIVSTPHGAAFGEKGGITDRYIRYHEEKAKGGCGVVMMFGSSSIHPTSVNDWGEVNNWDDSIIPQFRQMSEAIHRHGALCLSQISHRGRRGHSWYSGVPLWAPSDTREERHREWPHVMTKREIREVVDAWSAAAVRLQKGGYDGCDIPFYGGHLLENFLSPLTNKRTDEYGGLARESLPSHRARCSGPSATPSGPSSSSASATAATTSCRAASAGRSCSRSPAWSTASASPTTGW